VPLRSGYTATFDSLRIPLLGLHSGSLFWLATVLHWFHRIRFPVLPPHCYLLPHRICLHYRYSVHYAPFCSVWFFTVVSAVTTHYYTTRFPFPTTDLYAFTPHYLFLRVWVCWTYTSALHSRFTHGFVTPHRPAAPRTRLVSHLLYRPTSRHPAVHVTHHG
jgi:hypothetical protein